NETAKAKATEQQHNKQREAEFASQEKKLQSQYDALVKQRANLNKSIDSLSAQFQENEQKLSEKEKELTLATGSLGEIFGVVRQSAKDVQLEQERSVASIGLEQDVATINDIIEAKSIPSKDQLYGLWQSYVHQIKTSSQASII
ncbi:flagellar motor protein MotA, partial [Vibrio sp. 10N.222.49.C9]